MQLSYQKLGSDHPMYGKVDYLVADGTQPICYKTKEGYLPLESGASAPTAQKTAQAEVPTRPLYVLAFSVNGEKEEMTFGSIKKLDKMRAKLEAKFFISDFKVTEYKTVA